MAPTPNLLSRCLGDRRDLDNDALYRTCEHTDLLIQLFTHTNLWGTYGIVSQLVVCSRQLDQHEWILINL